MDNETGNQDLKKKIVEIEENVLKFWNDSKVFSKSLKDRKKGKSFVFSDGPPFATGLPHYGHILAGTMKDLVPRFQTMKGCFVRRKWGWDCHGLPVENLIEKSLNLRSKKEIENYGIGKFNEEARKKVMEYAEDWKKIIPRMGRWVDMDDDYRTMNKTYTESVWWSFKELYDKGLMYEGFKSMHLCPRCETVLSNFEVNQGYADITDISITVKFKLKGEKDTFILAWTTTPWTLPGNAALAVNPGMRYLKVKQEGLYYVVAEERLNALQGEYEIVERFLGKKMLGKDYSPVFDYYERDKFEKGQNLFKIYGADFVGAETGTGVVHIAPAFGEDDFNLSKKEGIPLIRHVGKNGTFNVEVSDFKGIAVKPKDDHQSTDILIIKNLAGRNLLYSKEKITHSYPHCWRCDTPLLNYASDSWFLKVTSIKKDLIRENKKTNWIPEDIRDGRFGNWLSGAEDWAISRSRFWGAPIPVWKCKSCGVPKAIGSIQELKNNINDKNNYFMLRHGEALHNKKDILSSDPDFPHHLTESGKRSVLKSAKSLKSKKIDAIFSSPFVRTKETALIVAKECGFNPENIIFDDRLSEINFGDLNGEPVKKYDKLFDSAEERFDKAPPNGENLLAVRKRVADFIYEVDAKYSGKNILILSHDSVLWLLESVSQGFDAKESVKIKQEDFLKTGAFKIMNFKSLPLSNDSELDLHRPFIDEIVLDCACGGKMKRVEEVFDCWYESGSMPFASIHYPFENKELFDPKKGKGFPADFIAEGIDQTRGWFYSLLVLSVALFGKVPYKNVLVNGTILAEDGRKMSKRLKNYPDPMEIVKKYGADSLRFYLLSSPVVKAEDINFSEKNVDEVSKKIMMRLLNVFLFYKLFSENAKGEPKMPKTKNILDLWIIARLNELIAQTTKSLEKYELDKAAKPINKFLEDLSVWYIRRSRDRFKSSDKNEVEEAAQTTRFVLVELAKIMAPFTPFISEYIYQNLKGIKSKESVHLESWPKLFALRKQKEILERMEKAREIVSLGLDARVRSGVKVRQPLFDIKVKDMTLDKKEDYLSIITDELNVKRVIFDKRLKDKVALNLEIDEELKEEGAVRDFVRKVQELRKKENLSPANPLVLQVSTSDLGRKFIEKNSQEISKNTSIKEFIFDRFEGEVFEINGLSFVLKKK